MFFLGSLCFKRMLAKGSVITLTLALACIDPSRCLGQALTMDGSSGVFFEPLANVVPALPGKWNRPTLSYHMVDAGPVAGDYINVSLEEGFGDWLEFGYTRGSHTDGGNPTFSPLFNYAGMNIFNAKVKLLSTDSPGHWWIPDVAVGGVIRTNVPYVSQYYAQKDSADGDIYGVSTKVIPIEKRVGLLLSGGVRGTNAEAYGYGGNATRWQARAFGALGIALSIKKSILSPTVEVDQEPHHLAYVSYANVPTSLIYAVRLSRAPDARWSIDMGTGSICNTIAPEINLRINHAVAVALNKRF